MNRTLGDYFETLLYKVNIICSYIIVIYSYKTIGIRLSIKLNQNRCSIFFQIFVSIDEHTTLKELANVLEIDVRHVQDAVSLYCRLGFARKKNAELDNNDLHPSWYIESRICRLSLIHSRNFIK